MTTRKPLGTRVDALEQTVKDLAIRQDKLERLAGQLRRQASETRRQMRDLERAVADVPGTVKKQLDAQTNEIRTIVAESETRNADRITSVARQWPAGAIVVATAVLAVATALVANWILAATHLPHVH